MKPSLLTSLLIEIKLLATRRRCDTCGRWDNRIRTTIEGKTGYVCERCWMADFSAGGTGYFYSFISREAGISMTVRDLLQRERFDCAAILRHGFTDYMRDYEVIVAARGRPWTDVHKYQFVGCVEAYYETNIGEHINQCLSDDFIYCKDYPDKPEPKGFIWGVRWSEGTLTYVEDGERAKYWSEIIGRKMHEVKIGTNAYYLHLVFADIRYAFLGHEPEVQFPKDYPLKVTEITEDGGVS
jgi:hypothetical protein